MYDVMKFDKICINKIYIEASITYEYSVWKRFPAKLE